jgi:predicted RNase H-like HicB family nuclease
LKIGALTRRTYVTIHDETTEAVTARFPDFPDLTIRGDSLRDTLTMAPVLLERHVEEMVRRGETLPSPTTPDLWEIHAQNPSALIGFVEVVTGEN